MYIVNSIINGKTVFAVNYVHFHGLLTNRDETIGPRRPFTENTPLRCVHNTYDQPRITKLTQLIFPNSIAALIPECRYYQFQLVNVVKYVTLKYDADFDYIYTSRGYLRDHEGYIDSLIANAPESNAVYGDVPVELVVHNASQAQNIDTATVEYLSLEGHQSSRMEKVIDMSPELVNTYRIVRLKHGIAFCDEYFEIIRPYLRDDYFCWQRYVEK